MKQEFSTSWNKSVQPRKQRKYLHNLPLHLKQKLMGCMLDKLLRKKYGIRTLEARKGDEVKVMRGKFKGKSGKIAEVNRTKVKAHVEGMNLTKKDGTKVKVWFHPSNLKIVKANEEDKKRFKRIKKTEEKNA